MLRLEALERMIAPQRLVKHCSAGEAVCERIQEVESRLQPATVPACCQRGCAVLASDQRLTRSDGFELWVREAKVALRLVTGVSQNRGVWRGVTWAA